MSSGRRRKLHVALTNVAKAALRDVLLKRVESTSKCEKEDLWTRKKKKITVFTFFFFKHSVRVVDLLQRIK